MMRIFRHLVSLFMVISCTVGVSGQTIYIDTVIGTCEGSSLGSIQFSLGGGVPPYSVIWSQGTAFQNLDTNTQTLTSLPPGIYKATVYDALLSIDTLNVEVSALAPAIISNLTVENDSGSCTGMISTSPTGGYGAPYAYHWSNGSTGSVISGLCGGEYHSVYVTDSGGCNATFSDSIYLVTPIPTVNFNSFREPTCSDPCNGELSITWSTNIVEVIWSGGDTIEAGDNSALMTGLCAGTYSVTVVDEFDISATSVFLLSNQGIHVTVSTVDPSCGNNDGLLYVDTNLIVGGAPPFQYNWNGAGTHALLNNISAGIYTVTITDSTGCETIKTSYVKDQGAAAIDFSGSKGPACFGDCDGFIIASTQSTTSIYDVVWSTALTGTSNSNTNITAPQNLCAGTYSVTLTDQYNCVTIKDTTFVAPSAFLLSETHIDESQCNLHDGSIDISFSGGTFTSSSTPSYVWNNGDTTEDRTNIALDVYIVTASDNVGCTATQLVTIGCPGECDNYINGRMLDNGNLLSIGTVYLLDVNDSLNYIDSTVSIINGDFTLANICPGDYKILGIAPGYANTYYYSTSGFDNAFNFHIDSNSFAEVNLKMQSAIGIDENQLQNNEVVVYPNPSSGGINIVVPNGVKIKSITANNILGNIVDHKDHLNSRVEQIDLSGDADGFYFIIIETTKGTIAKKVLVAK